MVINMNPESITQYVELGVQVIGVASVVATMTPTPADDGVLMVLKKILNILAFNFGHSRNAK